MSPDRRLPAEWEPQSAVLLTWPRPEGDFGDHFAEAEDNFLRMAQAIAPVTQLLIVAGDAAALRARLETSGVDPARLTVVEAPADDVWARDHGPLSVRCNGEIEHLDFRFNGWGGKHPADRDNDITARLNVYGVLPGAYRAIDYVLEGGALESDGAGTLLVTERCLLHPGRNGATDRATVEGVLQQWLGARRVLWLRHGDLIGDDTDGHVDTLARFASPQAIVYQGCDDAEDPHHGELEALRSELEALRDDRGQPYRLYRLPLPRPVHDEDGRRLPAGYANFLISNGVVFAPVYDDAADGAALAVLAEAFPRHRIAAVDCRALIRQNGSLHCATMQIPGVP